MERKKRYSRIQNAIILICSVAVILAVITLPTEIKLWYWSSHPFYEMTAADILGMDHYDLRYVPTEKEYCGKVYESISEDKYPHEVTSDHYFEYVIVEIVNNAESADYAILRHVEDTDLDYLLYIPERGREYFQFPEQKRPLGYFLKAKDTAAFSCEEH